MFFLFHNTIFFISSLISLIGVLLGVAFFTLVERKFMGLFHFRKGPNKVAFIGILQPISDALKLLSKDNCKIQSMKMFMFSFAPVLGMFLMLVCWVMYESLTSTMENKMKIFSIFAALSLMVFMFLMCSWGSNSKYSMLGGYRAISQVISYEVCLVIFLFNLFYICGSLNLETVKKIQENYWLMFFSLPMFLIWMMMCMAESNRTPFDLAEGESEIVSGFNIEYGGGLFAMIFITEYGMIMFLSFITSMVFMGGGDMTLGKTFLICIFFVWVRCCFPRVRYDNLMFLCWKIALPLSLCVLVLNLIVFFVLKN